jgi:co-chaperonin GroES (HSP10)
MKTTTACESPCYSTYEPIGDKVLLALDREDVNNLVSDDGILVPVGTKEKRTPLRDTVVVAVGPDCKQVQRGDVVRWNKLNGTAFPEGDVDLYFIPEPHLIAIISRRVPAALTLEQLMGARDEGTS